jgi:hypothetical protein
MRRQIIVGRGVNGHFKERNKDAARLGIDFSCSAPVESTMRGSSGRNGSFTARLPAADCVVRAELWWKKSLASLFCVALLSASRL